MALEGGVELEGSNRRSNDCERKPRKPCKQKNSNLSRIYRVQGSRVQGLNCGWESEGKGVASKWVLVVEEIRLGVNSRF